MQGLTQALYDRLVADGPLVAMLATYEGRPAVFTAKTIPEDAAAPYIVTAGQTDDRPDDCKNRTGRDVRRDIIVIDDNIGSVERVEAIADRVRLILHRNPIQVPGHAAYVAEVEGPRDMACDPDLVARQLELHQQSFAG